MHPENRGGSPPKLVQTGDPVSEPISQKFMQQINKSQIDNQTHLEIPLGAPTPVSFQQHFRSQVRKPLGAPTPVLPPTKCWSALNNIL